MRAENRVPWDGDDKWFGGGDRHRAYTLLLHAISNNADGVLTVLEKAREAEGEIRLILAIADVALAFAPEGPQWLHEQILENAVIHNHPFIQNKIAGSEFGNSSRRVKTSCGRRLTRTTGKTPITPKVVQHDRHRLAATGRRELRITLLPRRIGS